jgi:hypothetical protein
MSEPKRPDTIKGYSHPTTMSYSKTSRYKTFTEGIKVKNMNKCKSTESGKQYSTYGENTSTDQMCPTCNTAVIYTCPCAYNDKKCENGHIWYTSRDGKTCTGNPHQ